ncbi:histidine kinase [Sphingobium sp. H39-3-25]|uniref:sensor histidine kinase n=1 Tax=Sphingobium arseniciresistens TaxID=3030834 RepID=UPI0023B8A8AD|nr:histidine kinase [Sphingobium arseniciresistens]
MTLPPQEGENGVSPTLALCSILGFWCFYMSLVTVRAAVMGFEAQGEMAIRRGIVTIIGIVITWIMYLILRQFDRSALSIRIIVAFLAAVPGAFAIAFVNFYMFNLYDPAGLFQDLERHNSIAEQGYALQEIVEVALGRYFFLAAWAALYLAISYAAEARRIERHAARLEQAAQQAELRSLRYQVNPHFLFNTLNSLSSLVMTNKPDEAERMIMSLSNFYRTSLTGDPLDDVPLSEEVQLQQLYLEIETVRFPDRLRVRIDVPPALADCCVPGLILQPLVENAIKYGVSRTSRPVTVTIRAWEEEGLLNVSVSDDGAAAPGSASLYEGNGIGLVNVRDRLAARFGASGRLDVTQADQGEEGFVARLTMPIVRQGC